MVAHTLARVQTRTLANVEFIPALMLGADRSGPIGFRQAIDMGDVKAHGFHAFNHRRRWCSARYHGLDACGHALFHRSWRVYQQAVHDGGAAVVGHSMVANRVQNGLRIHSAQADVHRCTRCHRPGEAPAIAMEHGQRPQIDGMLGHVPLQHIADGIVVRAAVVVDNALGVARGAAGVVQRNRIPFVAGQLPVKTGIALGHKAFVIGIANLLGGWAVNSVLHLNHMNGVRGLAQLERLGHDAHKFRVNDQGLGFAVVQHEGQCLCIQPGVERVEHRTRHGHAKVRLHHGRRIGQHHGHGVILANADFLQAAG